MTDSSFKPLSDQMFIELEIQAIFQGKVIAFVPVLAKDEPFIGLGIAVANERGYCPVPTTFCRADKYETMARHADALNQQHFGLDVRAAAKIVASTMRPAPEIAFAEVIALRGDEPGTTIFKVAITKPSGAVQICTPEWLQKGPAQAYANAVLRGDRKPELRS